MSTTQLTRYDAARKALGEARRVDEVKAIRDVHAQLKAAARIAKDEQVIKWAHEIKLRAERKLGQMLKETGEKKQRKSTGRPKKNSRVSTTISEPTLSDLGISRDQSSQWQKLAEGTDEQFEESLKEATETVADAVGDVIVKKQSPKKGISKKKPPAQASEEIDVAQPKPKIATPDDIYMAVEMLARPGLSAEELWTKLPPFQHFRVADNIDAAIAFLQEIKETKETAKHESHHASDRAMPQCSARGNGRI